MAVPNFSDKYWPKLLNVHALRTASRYLLDKRGQSYIRLQLLCTPISLNSRTSGYDLGEATSAYKKLRRMQHWKESHDIDTQSINNCSLCW